METILKIIFSVGATVMALIPLWIYLLAKWAFASEGFWQNFILFGLGAWLLGGFQLILVIMLIVFLYTFWGEW